MSLTSKIFSSSTKRIITIFDYLPKIVASPPTRLQKVEFGQEAEEHIRASLKDDADADAIIKACCFYANVSNYRLENREQVCATLDRDHIPETLLQFARQSLQACDCRVSAELAWGGANMCVADLAKKYEIEMFQHGHKSAFVDHFFSPTILYGYWKSAEELHRGFYNGFELEFLDEGFEDSLERIEKFIKEVPQMKLHPKYVKEFEAKQVKWAEKKKEAEEWRLGNRMKPATLEEMNQKISKAERKKWAVKQYATIVKADEKN